MYLKLMPLIFVFFYAFAVSFYIFWYKWVFELDSNV